MNTEQKATQEQIDAAPTIGGVNVHDTYAVDANNEQVTVLGTMGQDPDEKKHVSWRTWSILALCALAQMQNVFLGIAPAANAYAIAGALNGMDKRIWIVQAQSVGSIATGPIMAIIADVYGRRYVVLAAFTVFTVSSIVGMLANNINQVIAAQTVAGLAAGVSGIMFAVASEVMPSAYRAWVQSTVNAASSTASVIALIAMSRASKVDPVDGWRWVFRTMLIFNGLLVIGFGLLYFPPPRTASASTSTLMAKIKAMDWIGYFLLLAGLCPLLMGFAWAGDSNYGWSNPHAYGPVAVGFAGFIACCLWEWKGTSRGFLDHRLFQNGYNFPLTLFLIAVEGSLFYLVNNIYSNQVYGLWYPTDSNAGARLLPFYLVIFVVAPAMSWYVTKTKDIKWPLCAGFVFFCIAVIGFAESKLNGNLGTLFNALGGIGFTAPLVLLLTMAQLSTPPLFIGIASALTISVRTLGGTVGYAIAEAIYGSRTNTQIPAAIAETAIALGVDPANAGRVVGAILSRGAVDPSTIPGVTGRVIGACYAASAAVQAQGFRITWYAFLPGSILAAIGCALLRNPKERMNQIVDAPLKIGEVNGRGDVESVRGSSVEQTKEH